ncbi:MAG TPA: solute carrier family 23 protein, partial [Cellvibrionaceae bacterium]
AGNWVVFAALFVSGLMTIVQARPIGPIGAGYVLFMGTSGAFIAVSIGALKAGGLPLLGTLIVASSLIQFIFARYLGLFRKIINPTVGGTVVTLIAVSVMPIAYDLLAATPPLYSGPVEAPMWTAAITLALILGLSIFGNKTLRLWGPVIGVVSGSLIAWWFGLVDLSGIGEAALIGLPSADWPGLNLEFDATFWFMLPGFMIVTIIGALETYGDGIAIQDVSQHTPKPTNYKSVQGAVNADGVGNLISGLMGTLPNTTYSTSVSVVDLTGVAARRVGIYGGMILLLLAFSPKISALLQAIPGPVAGVFIFFLIVLLFVHGIRLIISDGFSFDNGIVFGVAFWAGSGFQGLVIFHDLMPEAVAQLLDNGMTTGGIVAVILSYLVSLKRAKSYRSTVTSDLAGLAPAMAFTTERASALGWRGDQLSRLQLALEEAFMFQVEIHQHTENTFNTRISLCGDAQRIELELTSSSSGDNLEELIGSMKASSDYSTQDIRLRILRGIADDISHQQFNNADYLSVTLCTPVGLDRHLP